jgi:hypothetical protein
MSIDQDGYVIARGFLAPAEISALQDLAGRAYGMVDAGKASDVIASNALTWGGLGLPFLAELGCDDVDLAGMIERRAAPIIGPCKLVAAASLFRRVRWSSIVMWHIDADGADTKRYDASINVWVPLVSVGGGLLPSLEIIPGSHRVMRAEPARSAGEDATRTAEWVDAKFAGAPRDVPQLEPGDALLFDHYAMHRTQLLPHRHDARMSGEFRVTLKPI